MALRSLGSSGKISFGDTSISKVKSATSSSANSDIYKYHPERGISPFAKNALDSTPTKPSTITQSVQNTAVRTPLQTQRQIYSDRVNQVATQSKQSNTTRKEIPSPQPQTLSTVNNEVQIPTDRVKVTQKEFDPVSKTWKTTITYKEVESPTSEESSENSNTDIETAQGENEDKINDAKEAYATATLVYIATPMTITIKPGDTLTLLGLGKYLSGDWLVQDVTRNISSNGYTHQATVYKTDMITSLKAESTTSKEPESKTAVSSTETVNEQGGRILAYTVVAGDNYYSLTKKFKEESHMEYNNLVDQNSGENITEDTELKVGQVILIK